jgi:hypothetical protein
MLELTNLERSRSHVAFANALGATNPTTPEEIKRAALAFLATHDPQALGEALSLAECLDAHFCEHPGPHRFSLHAVARLVDDRGLAKNAAQLMGARPHGKGDWTTAGPGEAGNMVTLPPSLWADWLADRAAEARADAKKTSQTRRVLGKSRGLVNHSGTPTMIAPSTSGRPTLAAMTVKQ